MTDSSQPPFENPNPGTQEPSPENSFDWQGLIPLLVAAFFAFFSWLISWRKSGGKIGKSELIRPYNVDKKTFSKWVQHFCSDIIEHPKYKVIRRLPIETANAIRARLGEPGDETPPMGKRDIVDKAEGSYPSLRESVAKFPERFGLTKEAYRALDVFPPSIAARILEQYG